MADVSWIKVKVGMFDGESFKRIKRAKIGGERYRDKLTAVWFELMDFAAKCNHGGMFINSKEIPFKNIEDIAIMLDRETDELELCMRFFINEGMVEIIDDVYALSNWNEYQNEERLNEIRERERLKKARYRERLALKASSSVDNGGQLVDKQGTSGGLSKEEVEEEVEKEKEEEYHSFIHARETISEEQKRKLLGGSLGGGVVMISDEQFDNLCQMLSIDELDYYLGVIRDCEANGKHFKKTHYQAILDMARKDRKV